MDNRETLIQLGWHQGILLEPSDEFTKNAHYDTSPDDRLLVVSQTCDIVQGSMENEPCFETLCIRPLEKQPGGAYLGGKNSRRLEFSYTPEEGETLHCYTLPFERHLSDRKRLLDIEAPNTMMDQANLNMILAWLSRRYTRVAFPEAFVTRCKKRDRQLSRNFSRLNPLISNVYIRLTPFKELPDNENYEVELMLLMEAIDFDDASQYKECREIGNRIEDQFTKCPGLDVESLTIESSANLTIEELKGYLDWDYSYLTYREPENAIPPFKR